MDITLTEKEQEARGRVCLPLDGLDSMEDLRARVHELSPVVGLYKIGKETYTRFGRNAVMLVQDMGGEVFLDLKYHDIPNTVKGASRAAAELGVSMFNVHAPGGYEMMKAAVEGANSVEGKVPKVLGVTVLTSLDNLRYVQNILPTLELLPFFEGNYVSEFQKMGDGSCLRREAIRQIKIAESARELQSFNFASAIEKQMEIKKEKNVEKKDVMEKFYQKAYGERFDRLLRDLNLQDIVPDSVSHFAHMAYDARFDGIVCSAADLASLEGTLSRGFMRVTPGIKGPNTPAGSDQQRVFTPGNAIEDGASILVVGRAITGPKTSEGRLQAGYEILQDMAKHL